jgi:plasmid stability protein
MSEVRIRNVDEWIVESLRHQARSQGQTLEATLRELLRNEAMNRKRVLVEELRQMQEELRARHGTFSDSTIGIRQERDARM